MATAALPLPQSSLWSRHLTMLALLWAALLLLFHRDVIDIVRIWWDSSTYSHCLLLVPIIGWLVHQRREEVARLEPVGWWPSLLWTAGGALLWLLGELGGIALFRHAGLIVMLQGAVAATLGEQVTRGLLFPLFYMFFLVPFGEELVPPMQTITAKLSMIFLGWHGIPAHIEGVFITTPNGYFEVAEACSGVKFLVAMVAYSVLVANICFKSWTRRIIFLVVALIVPIIANGIRAYGTIAIAEKTGIEFAASFDHIVYGWLFFGAVMLLVMAIGWRFFDRKVQEAMIDPAKIAPTRFGKMAVIPAVLIALAVPAGAWGWAANSGAFEDNLPKAIAAPTVKGWTVIPADGGHRWRPRFDGADRFYFWRYRNNDGGQEVDLAIAAFAGQREGKELVGFGQGALDAENKWAWSENLGALEGARLQQYAAPGPVLRAVASWYRLGDETTASQSRVKLLTLETRLTAQDPRAAAILISAERHAGDVQPEQLIADFLAAGPGIEALADTAVGK